MLDEIDPPIRTINLEGAIELLGFGRFQAFIFVLSGVMWSADAMEVTLLTFLSDGAQCTWQLCPSEKALLSVLVFVGMLLGSPLWGYVSDIWGRKRCFAASLSLCALAAFLSALAPSYLALLACRFLVGVAIGGSPNAFGMCAEWMPNAHRGKLMTLFSVWWTAGIVFEILLAWAVLPHAGPAGWRYLLGLSALPLLALLLLTPLLPESPRFLYTNKRFEELEAILGRVARWNRVDLPALQLTLSDEDEPGEEQEFVQKEEEEQSYHHHQEEEEEDKEQSSYLQEESQSYHQEQQEFVDAQEHEQALEMVDPSPSFFSSLSRASCSIPRSANSQWTKLFQLFQPALRTRTLLLSLIWFSDAAIYYGVFLLVTEIFKLRYFAPSADAVLADPCGCQAVVTPEAFVTLLLSVLGELPGLAFAAYLLDKIGRSWTQTALFYTTALMALFLTVPSGYSAELLFFFVLRSAINSAFQVSFLASAELYPTRIRSTALGMFASLSRIGAMVAPLISQVLVLKSPAGSLILYALFALLNGTLSIFLPESMGQFFVDE